MCNPNTSTSSTSNTIATKTALIEDQPAEPPQTHLYFSISLPINITKPPEKQNHESSSSSVDPCPTLSEVINETKSLLQLSLPIALTALVLYSRSILSMLFLGHLGDMELAAGSLAIAFANITGYSVLSGLALGMEPLCSQAFGAQRHHLLSLTLQRSVLFLLFSSLPISLLWLNISRLLLLLHQDPRLTSISHTFLLFSLPDLLTHSFVQPIRIYLRAQGITRPFTWASSAAAAIHPPIAFLLVSRLRLGVAGVAAASSASNFLVLLFISLYLYLLRNNNNNNNHDDGDAVVVVPLTRDCVRGWKPLLRLAAPSCVSVCLEWWWYEIMIVMCGLLLHPKAPLAAMGILIQTTSLIYIFPSSLGFAVSTRVGNELGANRPSKARVAAAVAVLMAGVMGVSAVVFAAGVKDVWGRMFTGDVEIRRLTAAALPILGLCEIGNCPQTVACGVLRGSARPSTAAHVNLGAFYLVGMPVAVLLGFGLGVGFCGLWLGLLSAQVCCAGLMLYVVGTTDWEVQAQRAQMLTCAGREQEMDEPRDGEQENGEPLISIRVTAE